MKKLNITEDVLKEMADRMSSLSQEKENIQMELDKTRAELDRMKMACAIVEERKAEAELSLKTEIKFLISKLTKTKTKLAQNVQKTCNSASIENAIRQLRSISSSNSHPTPSEGASIQGSSKKQRKSENRYTEECTSYVNELIKQREIAENYRTPKNAEDRIMRVETEMVPEHKSSGKKEAERHLNSSKAQGGHSASSGKEMAQSVTTRPYCVGNSTKDRSMRNNNV